MKSLPVVLFAVALVIAGIYLYFSHQDKLRSYSPAPAPGSAAGQIPLSRRRQLLTQQLSQFRRKGGTVPESAEVQSLQQQLNAVNEELDHLKSEEAQPQVSQTTITIEDRAIASIIFGLIGIIVIFVKRFPESQKKYGFGMLVTILGFWLKP